MRDDSVVEAMIDEWKKKKKKKKKKRDSAMRCEARVKR